MENKPEFFGKYILLEKIASGGMAEIYLAKAPGAENVSKFIAIKRILPQHSNNHDFIDMFKEEAKIAVHLSHANVVSIIEFGEEKGLFYLAMQFVDGQNIRQILNRFKKTKKYFSIPQIVYIIKEAAKGLDYAHRCVDDTTGSPLNITHRDISPQNIMLSYDGEVQIIDFGIAKAESKIETTRVGTLKGKFGYMSPEQADGYEVDFRTDIFSLGIVLWELLAHDRLFVSNNEINTLKKIKECYIPSLRRLDPSIPQELERITMKALTRDRTLRYQSADELAQDLQVFLNRHHPEFTTKDLSQTLKALFKEEREENRKKMIEFSKLRLVNDEKTEFIGEKTATITETDSAPDALSSRALNSTRTGLNLNIDKNNNINNFDLEFKNELVRNKEKSRPQLDKQQLSSSKKPTNYQKNINSSYHTYTAFPYTQTSSVVRRDSKSPLRYLVILAILGAFYYVYQNTDLYEKIAQSTKNLTGSKTSSSVEELDKATPATYKLLVTSIPSGAEVFIDDISTQVHTPGQVMVPSGRPYSLKFEKPGYLIEKKSLITTKSGDEYRATLKKKEVAYINVSVRGGVAAIYVNGKKISDKSTVIKHPITANTVVKVQAYNPAQKKYVEKSVKLAPNTTRQILLDLSKSRTPSSKK